MVAKLFVLAAFALGAIAAPTGNAATTEPFRIGITFGAETLFLTAAGDASKNETDGVLCTIGDKENLKGVITCNNNLGFYYVNGHPADGALVARTLEDAEKQEKGTVFPLTGYVKSNQNWSIDADKVISWKTAMGPSVTFSKSYLDTALGVNNRIYADTCTTYGHPDEALFQPGTAKAYFPKK